MRYLFTVFTSTFRDSYEQGEVEMLSGWTHKERIDATNLVDAMKLLEQEGYYQILVYRIWNWEKMGYCTEVRYLIWMVILQLNGTGLILK